MPRATAESATSLAGKLGISRRSVFNFKKLYPAAPPFDDLAGWEALLRRHLSNHPMVNRRPPIGNPDDPDRDLNYETTRVRRLQGDKLSIEVSREMGEIVDTTEMVAFFTAVGARIKDQLRRLEHDFPCSLVGKDEVGIHAIVRDGFDNLLRAMARGGYVPDPSPGANVIEGKPVEPKPAS